MGGLIPVATARAELLALCADPTTAVSLPLDEALGRIAARDIAALTTHPPFRASAMDGYAVRAADLAPGASLKVIGESAAGRRFAGSVSPGEAVRIFTGAPVPEGADTILIQENATGVGSGTITATQAEPLGRFIRPEGLDYKAGEVLIPAGTRLDARHLALAAGMGHAALSVWQRPRIAILATGDELVRAGTTPGPDQIIASNSHALIALVREAGGEPIDLGIAGDSMTSLNEAFAQAEAAGAAALVTLGGASVGDHDLVAQALIARGAAMAFRKIAMRPGKPLMVGRMGGLIAIGLPGNPVSSIVCGLLFVQPLVKALSGQSNAATLRTVSVTLGRALPANDEREDYLRALVSEGPDGVIATAFERQDSSMLRSLTKAEALLIRPPHAPAAPAGAVAQAFLLA